MGELKLYQELKDANEDERLQLIAHAIESKQRIDDLSHLATKQDLELGFSKLEVKMQTGFAEIQKATSNQFIEVHKALTAQSWRLFGIITFLGIVFKLADLFIHR